MNATKMLFAFFMLLFSFSFTLLQPCSALKMTGFKSVRSEVPEGKRGRGLSEAMIQKSGSFLLIAMPMLFLPFSPPAWADYAVFSGGDSSILASKFNDFKYDPITNGGIKTVRMGSVKQADESIQSVEVEYDASKVSYKLLLGTYWRNVRPTQANGQFTDKGPSFRTVIWVSNESEENAAMVSRRMIEQSGIYDGPRDPVTFAPIEYAGPPLTTEVRPIVLENFILAENQAIDTSAVQKKYEKSGRAKYFKETYGVRSYSDPKTKVGGFVTFPCSNLCIKAIDGNYD